MMEIAVLSARWSLSALPEPAKSEAAKSVHPNLVLAICCMSLLLVGMDVTIVNVALPAIERDLHASLSQLQRMLDAYMLVVASRANGTDFMRATHPVWWLMTTFGAIVLLTGWVSTTPWACATTNNVVTS